MATEGQFTPAANIVDTFNDMLRPRLVALGTEETGRLRQMLSVPVEFRPNGDVIRSRRGEPPRKELGKLQASVGFRTEPQADGVLALEVFAQRTSDDGKDPNVAIRLEKMDRPFLSTSYGNVIAQGDAALSRT